MAKTIKKTTDKEAKKELRKSGALKGLSRKDKKMAVKKAGFKKRQDMRADMKAARKEDADIRKMFADRRREEARRGGKRLAYDVERKGPNEGEPSEVMQGIRRTSGSFGSQEGKKIMSNNERIITNREARDKAKPGETFMMTMKDGTMKEVRKPKVKAVKKAPGGASMKKMPEYEKGGALKSVPSDAKGLSKLPKSVRNKMGYMKNGGKVKGKKNKMSKEKFLLKQREAFMRNEIKESSLNPDSKKRADAKTQNQLDRAMRSNQIKKSKAMYGAKIKKAMYGAKMKKK